MPPYLVLLSMLLIFRVAPLLQVSDDSVSVPTVSFALPAQIRSESEDTPATFVRRQTYVPTKSAL